MRQAQPVLFGNFNNPLSAHNTPIKLPVQVATQLDEKAEWVIVTGRKVKNVSEAKCLVLHSR